MVNFHMRGDADNWASGRRCQASGRLLGVTAALVLGMALAGTARASEDETKWYSAFWPLGEPVHVEALKDEYVPFKSVGDIPARPSLLLELGEDIHLPSS